MVLEDFGLGRHEKSRVPSDLPKLGVSKTILDDAIDEAQCYWVILHFRVIKII